MKKKISLSTILLFSCLVLLKSQAVIGVDLGLNASSIQLETDNMILASDKATLSPRVGVRVGVNLLYKISHLFDLESGIYYANKGQNRRNTAQNIVTQQYSYPWQIIPDAYDRKENYNLNYLQIPLALNINFKSAFISCGLYGAFGVKSFHQIEENNFRSDTFLYRANLKENIWSKKDPYSYYPGPGSNSYARFDYGLSLGIGYRINRIAIKSNFDLGFKSILIMENSDGLYSSSHKMYKNRVLTFSVCYYLFAKQYNKRFD